MFENFVNLMIIINSMTMAITDYDPAHKNSNLNNTIELMSDVFTMIFTLECIIKILAMGFFMHRNSYLRDAWNWLDFIVVCTGMLDFI